MSAGTSQTAKATWARWKWSKGLGRWHRLFADGDLTKTACGSARKSDHHVAEQTAERPTSGPLCKVCEMLDDPRPEGLDRHPHGCHRRDGHPGRGSSSRSAHWSRSGLASCGAAHCTTEEGREYREALVAYEAEVAAAKRAAFAAFIATREAGRGMKAAFTSRIQRPIRPSCRRPRARPDGRPAERQPGGPAHQRRRPRQARGTGAASRTSRSRT